MAAEVVGRAVLPAREGWWPTWMQRLLGRGRTSRRRRVGRESEPPNTPFAQIASDARWVDVRSASEESPSRCEPVLAADALCDFFRLPEHGLTGKNRPAPLSQRSNLRE